MEHSSNRHHPPDDGDDAPAVGPTELVSFEQEWGAEGAIPVEDHFGVGEPRSLREAIGFNTQLLQDVLDHLRSGESPAIEPVAPYSGLRPVDAPTSDEADRLREENAELHWRIEQLESEVESLKASGDGQAIATFSDDDLLGSPAPVDAALSWEERKLQILKEMESDSFSADEFLETLQEEKLSPIHETPTADPIRFVIDLCAEVERLTAELYREEHERSVELGHEAKEELLTLQTQWEEKFRQTEIEISLERASLARERLEIEAIQEQLHEEMKTFKQHKDVRRGGTSGTKWMAKLGLISDES